MRFSNILLLSTLTSYTFGSIIPINQERDGLVIRVGNAASTSKTTSKISTSTIKTSSSSKISSSTTSSTKASTTSSASIKAPSSFSSSKVSSTSSSTKVADSAYFDQKFPTTGNTVYYNFEITNTTLAPDGKSRLVMALNGQYPRPTIIADWGDMISVTLKNSLQENGTGLHFHGMRQYHTNTEDGVPGITECPLAPGDTKTYTFQATQFGTSWYHSHFSGQYGEGVFGGILINGPATANHDIDLGTYTINDWSVVQDQAGCGTNSNNGNIKSIFTYAGAAAGDPILDYVATGNTSYPASSNLIELSVAGQWYYWIIQEVAGSPITVNVPHPIHLHGHDFYVLGTGTGTYNASTDAANLEYTNPTRRDVAMLPSGGWLALAFQTDNPCAWIMHCHIAWHVGEGLAVQFLESKDQITTVNPISSAWTKTYNNWNAWYPSKAYYLKDDSGI